MNPSFLRPLGVYGYDQAEPVILAALVSEEPLLLIGLHGTGKTFLLNSLSEALGLVHRHYNASLISFDDLVGFPYPEADGSAIRYIPTPATVWEAESVLIDEINRCKPEHQNRLFSLIQERRIQGLSLEKLRFRWAAMNPCGEEAGYFGTEPLDPALADRFAYTVKVADWNQLTKADRAAVADPRGDGAISRDGGRLRAFVVEARLRFAESLEDPSPLALAYAQAVVEPLAEAGLRLSPRRVRQFVRNLLAAATISDLPEEKLYRLFLEASLPHAASGEKVLTEQVDAVHRIAWDAVALSGKEQWLHVFLREKTLRRKARHLLLKSPDPDTASIAVAQFIAAEETYRKTAFALATLPWLLQAKPCPVGAEGLNDLTRIAGPALHQNGRVVFRSGKLNDPKKTWLPPGGGLWSATIPGYEEFEAALKELPEGERELAAQYLDALFAQGKSAHDLQDIKIHFEGLRQLVTAVNKLPLPQHGTAAKS